MGAEETAGGNSGPTDAPADSSADGTTEDPTEDPAGDSAEGTTGAPTEDPTDGAVAEAAELFVENGLWGYRTPEQVVVPPLYDCGFDFTEGAGGGAARSDMALYRRRRAGPGSAVRDAKP